MEWDQERLEYQVASLPAPAPTPTPGGLLPETGASAALVRTLFASGAAMVLVGAALVAGARRRSVVA